MIKLKLSYPILTQKGTEEVEVNVLKLDRLKLKHLKHLPDAFFDDEKREGMNVLDLVPLIAGASGLPVEAIEEVDLVDLNTIWEAIADLLGEYLQTGDSESGK